EAVNGLKNEINDLKNLITQLVNQQSAQQVFIQPVANHQSSNLDDKLLNKIAKDLKDIRAKTIGVELEGYKELTAEEVAIQARDKTPTNIIKDNAVEVKTKEININLDD